MERNVGFDGGEKNKRGGKKEEERDKLMAYNIYFLCRLSKKAVIVLDYRNTCPGIRL